jgi:arginyl-tRNA synthetase
MIGKIPEGLYPGEYLKDVGHALVDHDGKKWLDKKEEEWLEPVRDFAVKYMMKMIRSDLDLIGIHHDVFTNEREIVENGTLEKVFKTLIDMDLIYQGTLPPPKGKEMEDWEPAELTLFRSSKFGDSFSIWRLRRLFAHVLRCARGGAPRSPTPHRRQRQSRRRSRRRAVPLSDRRTPP